MRTKLFELLLQIDLHEYKSRSKLLTTLTTRCYTNKYIHVLQSTMPHIL